MITHTKKSCKIKLNMTGDIIKFLRAHRLQYVFLNGNNSAVALLFMGLRMYRLSTPPLQG